MGRFRGELSTCLALCAEFSAAPAPFRFISSAAYRMSQIGMNERHAFDADFRVISPKEYFERLGAAFPLGYHIIGMPLPV